MECIAGAVLNINVGILGHVDSGKTTLAKALSDIAGTAAFDKNPQSQERGITIDLGFSALLVDIPNHLHEQATETYEKLQFTFVDCPGHASLIRTIIGGAQIIHMMILVVDVTKGIQTQTAECLVIGEIMCKKMIVVLNKIDLLQPEKRSNMIQKMKKKIMQTLADTSFRDVPIVAVTASSLHVTDGNDGLQELLDALKTMAFIPKRHDDKPFIFAVDHCFGMRGHGTVMTGTVLQGRVSIKDVIEVPSVCLKTKVKSIQMYRRPVQRADEGDRIGICVAQMEPKHLERSLVCTPGYITAIWAALVTVNRIKYFRGHVKSKSKFHISISHETVMASITVFKAFSTSIDSDTFKFNEEYEYQEELVDNIENQFMLLKFEKPVLAPPAGLVIGSRLEMDVNGTSCRLAFWGKILQSFTEKNFEGSIGSHLKIYKRKSRKGIVERIMKDDAVIVKNLIKKETDPKAFIGLQVALSSGEMGKIESTFGKSGKLNVLIPGGLKMETLLQHQKIGGKKVSTKDDPIEVTLEFKRYIFDLQKKIIQSLP